VNVDSMDIAEVKIGMFVRGNDRYRYYYTNSDMTLGVIIDVHKNNNTIAQQDRKGKRKISAPPRRGKRAEKIGKMLDKERKCAYYDKVNKYSSGR